MTVLAASHSTPTAKIHGPPTMMGSIQPWCTSARRFPILEEIGLWVNSLATPLSVMGCPGAWSGTI
jgi:hypothetical protein